MAETSCGGTEGSRRRRRMMIITQFCCSKTTKRYSTNWKRANIDDEGSHIEEGAHTRAKVDARRGQSRMRPIVSHLLTTTTTIATTTTRDRVDTRRRPSLRLDSTPQPAVGVVDDRTPAPYASRHRRHARHRRLANCLWSTRRATRLVLSTVASLDVHDAITCVSTV